MHVVDALARGRFLPRRTVHARQVEADFNMVVVTGERSLQTRKSLVGVCRARLQQPEQGGEDGRMALLLLHAALHRRRIAVDVD